MRLVRATALGRWQTWKSYNDLEPDEYREWQPGSAVSVICVSHRWLQPDHPDPHATQLRELQRRLAQFGTTARGEEPDLVFFDFCSLPQGRSDVEDRRLNADLDAFPDLFRWATTIVLSEGYSEYKDRAWCFLEVLLAEKRMRFFDDQQDIRSDLDIFGSLLLEIPQITAFDFKYEVKLGEAEVIAACFQHLQTCSVTVRRDAERIKRSMTQYFNQRQATPYARLLVGALKFFSIRFVLLTNESPSPIQCLPRFTRGAGVQIAGSLFCADPAHPDVARTFDASRYCPAIELLHPGVDDYLKFTREFSADPEWERFVISPMMLGSTTSDAFPDLAHVMHTLIETKGGLAFSPDYSRMYLPLGPAGIDFRPLVGVLTRTRGFVKVVRQMVDGLRWKLRFFLDLTHPRGMDLAEALGFAINNPEPGDIVGARFLPISAEEYGGNELGNRTVWMIESTEDSYTPSECATLLERKLPRDLWI